MKKINIIIFFIILCSHFTKATTSNDSIKAGDAFAKGKAFHDIFLYDSAIYHFKISRNFFKEKKLWLPYWESSYKIGLCYRSKGELNYSLYYLKEAKKIAQKHLDKKQAYLGSSYEALSNLYARMGNVEKQILYAKLALKTLLHTVGKQHQNTAYAYDAMAWAYARLGVHQKELECYQQQLSINKKLHGSNDINVALAYIFVGVSYGHMGNYPKKLEYCQKALAIIANTPDSIQKSPQAGQAYFISGIAFLENEKPKKAIPYFIKNDQIIQKKYSKEHQYIGLNYAYLGYAHLKANKHFKEAYSYLNHGLTILQNALGKKHIHVATAYNYLGEYYLSQKNTTKAIQCFQEALKINHKKYGNTHVFTAESYFRIAEYHFKQKAYIKAQKAAHKCLVSLSHEFNNQNINVNPTPNIEVTNKALFIKALQLKAQAIKQKSTAKDSRLNYWLQSWEVYLLAIQWINKAQKEYSSEEAKHNLYQTSHKIFEQSIQLAHRLHQITKNKNFIEKAFQIAEQSKGIVLLEALQENQAKKMAGIPSSLLQAERNIKINITYYQKMLFEAQKNKNNKQVLNYKSLLFNQRQKLDSMISVLEKKFPSYHKIKYNLNLASIKKVQQGFLQPNTALIEYFWGEKHLFVFLVTAQQTKMFKTPIDKNTYKLIRIFTKNLKTTNYYNPQHIYTQYTYVAHRLFNKLFKNVHQNLSHSIQEIILIPDGPLGLIPFETLLFRPSQHKRINYTNLSYLIKKYSFTYGYSTTHMLQKKSPPSKYNAQQQCIAFAPSFGNLTTSNTRGSLTDLRNADIALPGAQQEVKQIANYFKGAFFFAQDANEKTFKEKSSTYPIVHLALHGKDNRQTPLLSFLNFGNNELSTEDNRLYAYELYNLSLEAEMVVLSACETGSGKYVKGEGVISLAHGFLLAGSASVVSTLWSIPDQSSSEIMQHFYRNLAQQQPKNDALRNAKINFINNTTAYQAHPAFWAGFIVSGNSNPIYFKENISKNLLIFIISTLFFIIILQIILKKATSMH